MSRSSSSKITKGRCSSCHTKYEDVAFRYFTRAVVDGGGEIICLYCIEKAARKLLGRSPHA